VDVAGARVDHGLGRQRHPGPQLRAGPGGSEVRYLRVLVHVAADPVPDELPDDRVAGRLHVALDGGAQVAQPVAGLGLLHARPEGLLGDADQAQRLRADPADRDGAAHVGPEAVQDQAQVEADDVALMDRAPAGDAVDDLVVDRDAGRLRIVLVAEEAGPCAALPDQAVGQAVEVAGGHAGLAGRLPRLDHRAQQALRGALPPRL